MTPTNIALAQHDAGLPHNSLLKDQAITGRAMRFSRIPDSPNPAFPHPCVDAEEESPTAYIKRLNRERAGLNMSIHI